MFHCTRFQVFTLRNICKIPKILPKSITLENRLYYRQGLFDDGDESYPDKESFKRDRRVWNSNKFSNHRSEANSFNRRNEGYASRNIFNNNNRGGLSNQNFRLRRSFGQEFGSATFNEKDLTPIEKYLYVEHKDVTERAKEEVESFRRNSRISVTGSDVPKPITNFDELCLPEELKKVILEQEYSDPTPIQAQGWPIALSGKDMVGISQTGSGKTLVFMIPALVHALNQPNQTKLNECSPQVLVLAPTRELVQQISEVSSKFCDACQLVSACAYGGSSRNVQLRCLKGAHICVATPGRLIDFTSEGSISLNKCTYLVLDEADRMLDMGFEPQIRQIINQIRPDRQTLMWSATWPPEIRELAEDFLKNYVKVTVGDGQLVANPNIEQNVYVVDELEKEERLFSLLERLSSEEDNKVLIFAQTKKMVDYLGRNLNRNGIKSIVIHGDVSQAKRDYALNYFRKKKNCVLIATDVAARGLDITDVQHVINYDFPLNIEDYIHRIGRTARGTSTGVAHSFFTSQNIGVISDLIAVLKQAKQDINPELYALAEKKNRNRGYSKPFNRQRYQYASQKI